MATNCPACAAFAKMSPNLCCNAHRVESVSAGVIRRAREAGHVVADGDWKAAEKALGARPVVIG